MFDFARQTVNGHKSEICAKAAMARPDARAVRSQNDVGRERRPPLADPILPARRRRRHSSCRRGVVWLLALFLIFSALPLPRVEALGFKIPKSLTGNKDLKIPQTGESGSAGEEGGTAETSAPDGQGGQGESSLPASAPDAPGRTLLFDSEAGLPMMSLILPGAWNVLNSSRWDAEQAMVASHLILISPDGDKEFSLLPSVVLTVYEQQVGDEFYSSCEDESIQNSDEALAYPDKVYSAREFIENTLFKILEMQGADKLELISCDELTAEDDPEVATMTENDSYDEGKTHYERRESLAVAIFSYEKDGREVLVGNFFHYVNSTEITKEENGDYVARASFGPVGWFSYTMPATMDKEEGGEEFMTILGSLKTDPLWTAAIDLFADICIERLTETERISPEEGRLLIAKAVEEAKKDKAMMDARREEGWEQIERRALRVENGLSGHELTILPGFASVWADADDQIFYFVGAGQPDQYDAFADIEWGELLSGAEEGDLGRTSGGSSAKIPEATGANAGGDGSWPGETPFTEEEMALLFSPESESGTASDTETAEAPSLDKLPRTDVKGRALKIFNVFDSQVNLPMCKIMLPEGWNLFNSTSWGENATSPVSIDVRAFSADQKERLHLMPAVTMTFLASYQGGECLYSSGSDPALQQGEMAASFPDHFIDIWEFMESVIPDALAQKGATDIKLVWNYEWPGIELPQQPPFQTSFSNGIALYRLTTPEGEDCHLWFVLGNYENSQMRQSYMPGQEIFVSEFGPISIMSYRVPRADFSQRESAAEFARMINSMGFDPSWLTVSRRFSEEINRRRSEAELAAAQQQGKQQQQSFELLRDSNQLIQQQRQEVINDRQMAQERIATGWGDFLSGTERAVNPATGEELSFSNQLKNTWASGDNQIFQTDDNSNPNQMPEFNAGGAEWQKLTPDD